MTRKQEFTNAVRSMLKRINTELEAAQSLCKLIDKPQAWGHIEFAIEELGRALQEVEGDS